jgi:hypothetical protein
MLGTQKKRALTRPLAGFHPVALALMLLNRAAENTVQPLHKHARILNRQTIDQRRLLQKEPRQSAAIFNAD